VPDHRIDHLVGVQVEESEFGIFSGSDEHVVLGTNLKCVDLTQHIQLLS